MKKTFLTCFALLGLMCHQVKAQTVIDTWSMTTGVDTTLWYNIDGVDSTIIFGNNTMSARSGLVDIGFSFTLGETTHTKFSTNINGTVRLGNVQIPSNGYYSQPLGAQSQIGIGPKIEPLGWRGRFDNTCYTRKALLGTAGNRVLVIETRMKDCGRSSTNISDSLYVSFQVQLFETGGFRVIYGESDSAALTNHTTQNGVSANVAGSAGNYDIVFFDFATHEEERFDVGCTLTNAAEDWPEKGRWYMMVYDSTLCPYPSTVTTTATDPANVTLQNPDGGTLHVVIPAMGIDTLWTGTTLNLGGGFNPATTYQGTMQTVCDSITSLRTRTFSFTTGCGPVLYLPWVSEFENYNLNCWDASQYTSSSYCWHGSNGYAAGGGYAGNYHYDEWLISPVLNLPNEDGLVVKFWYRALNDQQHRSNTVDVRVAPCTAAGVVDSADWTTVLTLTNQYSNNIVKRISLDTWRGQPVKVAFVLTGVGGNGVYLSRAELLQELEPVFSLKAPTHARTGERVTLTAQWVTGATSGMVYQWHSSLLDTTWTSSTTATLSLLYPSTGTDTVTLVVSNLYGADTHTAIYHVFACPAVSAFPWTETFIGGSKCWYVPAGSNWYDEYFYNSTFTVIDVALVSYYMDDIQDHWIISPAIQMPADTADFMILEWNDAAEMNTATHQPSYSVLVSTDTNFLDLTTYDTLLTVNSGVVSSGGSWQNWGAHNVSIAAYAGQTIHVAFCRHPSYYGIDSEKLRIDNVTVRSAAAPIVTLTAPTRVENIDTVTFTTSLIEGIPCSYTWSSSLLDTSFVSTDSIVSVVYPIGGTDTVKVVATNAFGSDSATAVVNVVDCTPFTLPWTEDFDSLPGTSYAVEGPLADCWRSHWNGSNATYAPHVINTYPYNPVHDYFTVGQQALLMMAGTSGISGIDSVAIVESPMIVGDFYNKRLSFYYMHERSSAGQLSVGYMQDSTFVTLANLPQQQTGQAVSLRLDSIPAGIHRFALKWKKVDFWYGVIVDNVELSVFDTVPTVSIATPQYVGSDSILFRAYLTDGLSDSITYNWQSTMAAAGQAILTAVGDSAYLVYTAPGTDTVSVVATNSYGSDTAWVPFTFVGAPIGTFTGPSAVDTYDTVAYAAYQVSGSTIGVSFSWQSTMSSAGQATIMATGDTLRMVYLAGGTDTLTLITSNAFGTDSTVMVVNVNYVPLPGSPVVSLQGYSRATMCDTASFVATLLEGDTAGLTYTWHSTKAARGDAVMVPEGNRLKISYSSPQTDTVTVTASNINGWRSTAATTFVLACEVRDSLPYLAPLTASGSDIYDWQPAQLCNPRGNIYDHYHSSNWWNFFTIGIPGRPCVKSTHSPSDGLSAWLISPPIQLPDSLPDTLSWNDYCYYSTYHVLVSPSEYVVLPNGYIDTSYFTDTVYTGTGATWWNRRTVDLSVYAGHTIHIAFVHSGPSSDPNRYTVAVAIDSMRVWAGANRDTVAGPCPPVTNYPWSEDFDNHDISITSSCWEMMHSELQFGGYYNWYRAGTDTGNYFMRTNQPARGETASDWLITPPLALPPVTSAGAPKLSWRMFANHVNEVYEVRISPTANADSAAFTQMLFTETGPFAWSDRSLYLDQYAGQTVRIAFRNVSTGRMRGGGDYMGIDEISVWVDSTIVSPDTVWRTVTLAVDDTAMGTVTGGGLYPDSSVVTISAIPFEGYHFMGWNDGDTQAMRTVMVVSDTAFIATFEANVPDTVWRTVSVVRNLEGMVDEVPEGYVSGAGIYADGDTVTLTLLTLDYKCPPYFYGWVMAPGDTVFDDECTFVVTSDTTITAYYLYVVGIPDFSILNSQFTIFPNPASKTVTVLVAQPTTLTLLNVTGREIGIFEIQEPRFELDVSALPAGVYFLRLADNPTVGKLIKTD